jgi:hypothetical protein
VPQSKGRIAILKDDIPVDGVASSPESLAKAFQESNHSVTFLNCEELGKESVLNKSNFDILVLPYGASFPSDAGETIRRFLKQGGHFISMGGYAFDNPLFKIDGQWKDEEAFGKASNQLKNANFEVDSDGDGVPDHWKPDDKEHCRIVDMPNGKAKCAMVKVTKGDWIREAGWSHEMNLKGLRLQNKKTVTLSAYIRTEGVTGHAAIGSSYPGTAFVRIDQYDASDRLTRPGLEGILHMNETKDWQRYKSTLSLNEKTTKLIVKCGLWEAWGVAWFKDICLYEDTRVNTRNGLVRDGLYVEPYQIGVFDPSYRLERVQSAKADENQNIVSKNLKLDGELEGYAAAAWLGSLDGEPWARSQDVRARWTPLINAYDKYGRSRGAIGAVIHNYGGYYKDSIWAYFGVTNRDLFAPQEKQALKALAEIADHMMTGLFLHHLSPDYACYKQGETANIALMVHNCTKEEKKVTVRIQVFEEKDGGVVFQESIPVKVLTTTTPPSARWDMWAKNVARAEWKAGRFDKDFYYVKAFLEVDGKAVDTLDTGFVVWNPEILKNGVQLDFTGNYFHFGGRTDFLCGTKTGSFYLGDIATENPLRWDRRFQKMQDNRIDTYGIVGLRGYFTDLRNPDERTLRRLDAIIQLCHKHKVIPLVDLQLHPSAFMDWTSDFTFSAVIGHRYNLASGLLYHVSGDVMVYLQNTPSQNRELNKFLAQEYGSEEKLLESWGSERPTSKLGEIEVEEPPESPWEQPSGKWYSVKTYDLNSFRNHLYRLFQAGCVKGLKSGAAPNNYVTTEFWLHLDQLNDSDDLDFATQNAGLGDISLNKHYYAPLLKFTDMRAQGKSVVIGEYGSQVHPTFDARGYSNETADEQITRFKYVNYYTFGLGGSGVADWDWENKEYYIFPWGLVNLCDFTDRKILKVYRNLSIFLKLFNVRYDTPKTCFLIADSHRYGGTMMEVHRALLSSIDMLIGTHADFLVLNEFKLDRLPRDTRVLVWPIPWCPKDETVETVKSFVERGGILYVSGDISFSEHRRRDRTGRLRELLGVEFVADNYPNIDWKKGKLTRVEPVEDFYGIKARNGRPCIKVRATTARIIAKDEDGNPAITANKLGKGTVFYNADPFELYTVAEDREGSKQGVSIYKAFLTYANAEFNEISPDDNLMRIFKLKTEDDGILYILYNANDSSKEVTIRDTRKPITLTLGSMQPGVVFLGGDEEILALESQGDVSVGGETLLNANGHFAIAALDGKDITKSNNLLVFAQSEGDLEIASKAKWSKVASELGDIIDSKWVKLEETEAGKKGNSIQVSVSKEQATSIVLVAEGTVTPLINRMEKFIAELEPLR